jgi:hypothetical protein
VTAPAAVTLAGPVLVMLRSAEAVTAVVEEEVLLVASGSAVVEEMLEVLVREADCAGAVTTTVTVGPVVPVVRVGRVQVTETLPVFAHVQPVPAADTKVTPTGKVSVTVTFEASDGPLFAATREYVTEPAAVTVAGPVLVIDRSADAVTVVVDSEVLFAPTGSLVAADTVAEFVSVVACAGAVRTTVRGGAVAPAVKAARVHVTETLPEFVHVHPVPAAETKLTPDGRVSSTERFAASDGPLFTTES